VLRSIDLHGVDQTCPVTPDEALVEAKESKNVLV
jgi:hypothetical protein